jgi:hypothetical protein
MPDQPADPNAPNSQPGRTRTSGVGPVLREQAGKLADRTKEAGVETADAVGKAAERAAQELEDSTPELASYIRDAANYAQRFSSDLHDRSAADLLDQAIEWSRKQPLMALAGAAVVGFALSRVIKTGLPEDEGPRS